MNRTDNLLKNSFIYFVASFASKFLSILLIPIYVSYLTADDFGESNLLLLLSGVIGIIYMVDAIDGSYRFLLSPDEDKKTVITSTFFLYVGGSFVFLFLLGFYLYAHFSYVSVILCMHVVFTNFQTLVSQLARGLKFNRIFAESGVLMSLSQGILNIIMIIFLKLGGVSILLAPIFASILTTIFIFKTTHLAQYFDINAFSIVMVKRLVSYGFPLCVCIVMSWLILNSGTFVLTYLMGSAKLSGVYAIAVKVSSIVYMVMSIFNMAWQETAVDEFGKSDCVIYYNKVFNKYINLIMGIVSLLMSCIFFYFYFCDTKSYQNAMPIIPFMLVGNCFYSLQNFLQSGFYVLQKTNSITHISLITAVSSILLGVVFIPFFYLNGLVISVVGGQIVMFLLTYFKVKNIVGYRLIFDKNKWGSLFLLLCAVVAYYIGSLSLCVLSFSATGCVIAYKEKDLLSKMIAKIKKI